MSSYKRALRPPTFFLILRLTRLEVKSRCCRSSWRAFGSIHPLMLSPTSPRKVLFACSSSPPQNVPFFISPPFPSHAPALVPLSLAKVRLSLTLLSPTSRSGDLNRWLCSFSFFSKGGFGVFANSSLYGSKAALSFSTD